MIVQTEFDSKIRKRELEIQKKEEKEKDESEVKNRNFTQTYPKGWQRIRELAKGLRLWLRNAPTGLIFIF